MRALAPAALACLLTLISPALLAWDSQRIQQTISRLEPRATAAVQPLLLLLREASVLDEVARLSAVNDFYNQRVVFGEDLSVWGVTDYWASPLETLARGAGDCEDYAIAKYFSLLAAGVPDARLRLVYARVIQARPGDAAVAHMVLAYYVAPGAEPLILDNLVSDVRGASRRADLVPVFSFNIEGLWSGVDVVSSGDPAARLFRWRELLAKVREEGFL